MEICGNKRPYVIQRRSNSICSVGYELISNVIKVIEAATEPSCSMLEIILSITIGSIAKCLLCLVN